MSDVNVGLTAVRGVANGLSPIQTPSQNTVAILMKRMRGVDGKVYVINSPEEDEEFFGGSYSGTYGAEVVAQLFTNSAPFRPTIYAARLVASDAVAATGSLSGSGITIPLTAAQKGEEDKGAWANGYYGSLKVTPRDGSYTATLSIKDSNGNTLEEGVFDSLAQLVEFLSLQSNYVTSGTVTLPTSPVSFTSVTLPTYSPTRTVEVVPASGLVKFQLDSSDNPQNIFYTGASLVTGGTSVGTISSVSYQSTGSVGTVYAYVFLESGHTLSGVGSGTLTSDWSIAEGQIVLDFTLSGGEDGNVLESDAYPTPTGGGLAVFDSTNAKITTVVDFFSPTMFVFGRDYASSKQDTFYVQSLSPTVTRESFTADFLPVVRSAAPSFGALYHGWTKVFVAHKNDFDIIPSIGYVIGAGFIKTPAAAGGFVHIPPAGLATVAVGTTGIVPESFSQADINFYAQQGGVNVIQSRQNVGSYIVTSRTTSSNSLYHSIHTILQANYYQQILQDNMLWALQVPNTPELKDRIVSYLNDYFFTEYENGALERSVPFSSAFSVLDRSGNDRKIIDFEIRYIPSEATESLVLRLNRNDGSLIVSLEN